MKRTLPFLLITLLWAGAGLRDLAQNWVDTTNLPPFVPVTSVEVKDRDGHLLRAYTTANGLWRLPISLSEVDDAYLDMLVAYEDQRFWEHNGVDGLALLRAAGQAVRSGRITSGASTLTMQVARLIEDSGTGKWAGKIRQIRLALAMEQHLSKGEILSLYLHHAPFGGNIEGISAASRIYFGKPPARLTPSEAALLVALPQSPEKRRPDLYPETAQTARNRIIDHLQNRKILTKEQAETARHTVVPSARRPMPLLAPHMADRAIATAPLATEHRLTLLADLQNRLERLAADTVRQHGAQMQIALMIANHQTGEILASVGSAAYQEDARKGFIDMTQAVRSPGSTLKPLIYGMAFDAGLAHPESLITDRLRYYGTYAPQNFDGRFRGTLRLRDALQLSLNTTAVALTEIVGPARLFQSLKDAGTEPVLADGKPGLAIALGGVGLRLTDLVTLYAGLAQQGQTTELHWRKVRSTGVNQHFLSDVAAYYVADILADVPAPATARNLWLAYKTGTSYGHRDTWAIGFDGMHVAGVWMGRADGTPVPGAFGADLAAPVLFEVFSHLNEDITPLPAAPKGAFTIGTARLPHHLRHIGETDTSGQSTRALSLRFPPNNASLPSGQQLTVKIQNGIPPFALLLNDAPVQVRLRQRQSIIPLMGTGFHKLSVIDATGQSTQSHFRILQP